uniref:Putative tail protein n=1 Tax=viral metagenome TaxID=1070528 RepID=A0A6M3KVZ1_9ZZZZ
MSFNWYGEEAKKQIYSVVEIGLRNMAADVVKQAKDNANQPQGSGSHPQVQTGTLRRSITMDMVKEGDAIYAKVGIMKGKEQGDMALEYAQGLEFGTATHPPYPYLYPAAAQITKNARKYF